MALVAHPAGLFRRGGVWYYRKRVPSDLVKQLGHSEIKVSLGTELVAEARLAALEKAAELEKGFALARSQVLTRRPRASSLSLSELRARAVNQVRNDVLLHKEIFSAREEWDEREERLSEEAQLAAIYKDKNADDTIRAVTDFVGKLVGPDSVRLNEAEKEELDALALEAVRAIQTSVIAEISDRPRRTRHADFDATNNMSFGELTEAFLAYYRNERNAGQKRIEKIAAASRFATQFFGSETLIRHLSRHQCREFRDLLRTFPKNAAKHFPNDNRSLTDIASEGRRRSLPVMAYQTQETYLGVLRMMLDWAVVEEHLSGSPAIGLALVGSKPVAKEQRSPFSTDQLTAIFGAPLYVGCRDDAHGYAIEGTLRPRGTRFWIPLVALFSGMRLNEICQLDVADIKRDSRGTWYFDLNEDGDKSLKNGFGKRIVPIHPTLIELGFLQFVETKKVTSTAKLFDDLRRSPQGHYSERFSRWFNEGFLPKVHAKTSRSCFHSFRHNFRDALRRGGVITELANMVRRNPVERECIWSRNQRERIAPKHRSGCVSGIRPEPPASLAVYRFSDLTGRRGTFRGRRPGRRVSTRAPKGKSLSKSVTSTASCFANVSIICSDGFATALSSLLT